MTSLGLNAVEPEARRDAYFTLADWLVSPGIVPALQSPRRTSLPRQRALAHGGLQRNCQRLLRARFDSRAEEEGSEWVSTRDTQLQKGVLTERQLEALLVDLNRLEYNG